MPTEAKAGPQSQEYDACIFLILLTWQIPWYSLGGHSGGIKYSLFGFSAKARACATEEVNDTTISLSPI